ELDHADALRRRLVGDLDADGAVGADRDAERAARDRHRRLHQIAECIDHLALGVDLETAVARVGDLAGRHQDLEKAGTVNREIERVAGLLQAALRLDRLGRDDIGAGALLQTRGKHCRLRREGAGLRLVLIEQILEHRTHTLETRRVDVRQIVRDHVHLSLLTLETASDYRQRFDHAEFSPRRFPANYCNDKTVELPWFICPIVCMSPVCIWNIRWFSIRFIIMPTESTLLCSSAPDLTRTLPSIRMAPVASANNPSVRRVICFAGGFASMMRSKAVILVESCPSRTPEMVPSSPIVMFCSGGSEIGPPPWPSTGWPSFVIKVPLGPICSEPLRV